MAEVNFHSNESDIQCAIMGALGMSTKAIIKRTHLTPCQVTYRLNKKGIKRADYRNGEGFAKVILNSDIEELVRDKVMD